MNILDSILTKEQIELGFTLKETESFVYLGLKDAPVAMFPNSPDLTIGEIRHRANQEVQWLNAGIAFKSCLICGANKAAWQEVFNEVHKC